MIYGEGFFQANPWASSEFVPQEFCACAAAGTALEAQESSLVEVFVRALTHIMAVTGAAAAAHASASASASASGRAPLPSLHELAVCMAMASILAAECSVAGVGVSGGGGGSVVDAALQLLPQPNRPTLRALSLATLFQSTCKGVWELGLATCCIADPGAPEEAAAQAASLSDPATDSPACSGSDQARAYLQHLAAAQGEAPLPPLPPHLLYSGRLFHGLLAASQLAPHGFAFASPALPPPTFDDLGRVSAASLLHPAVRATVERLGALEKYEGMWAAALAPFDPRAHCRGYAALYFEACGAGSASSGVQAVAEVAQVVSATGGSAHSAASATAAAAIATATTQSNREELSEQMALMGDLEARLHALQLEAEAAAAAAAAAAALPSHTSSPSPPLHDTGHTAALPILAFRDLIAWSSACRTVCIVKADTGSGKSSQIPQYIYHQAMQAAGADGGGGGPPAAGPCASLRTSGGTVGPIYSSRSPGAWRQ